MYTSEDIKDPMFDIPEGYFEKMQMNISARIHKSEKVKRHRTVVRRLYMGISAAAVLTVLYIGISNIGTRSSVASQEIEIVSAEQLNEYVSQIQEKYSYTSAKSSDVMTETSSITDMYMSLMETQTETQTEEKTNSSASYTEEYETGYYNIMELASL